MAIDNTPPRLKLIITIAVITVITLVGIDFVLRSYYGYMTDDAQQRKLAPTTALDDHRAAEKSALAAANVDQALNQLAKGSRTEAVTPTQSDDVGPLTGWSKLPKQAPTPEPHGGGAAVPPTGHDSRAVDGGVLHAAADAGAHKPAADAGATAPKGAPRK